MPVSCLANHNLSGPGGIGRLLLCLSRLQKQSTLVKLMIEMLAWRIRMKNILRTFCSFSLVLALFVPVLADTIRLKDGSVIRGQVVGFKDQQFTVLIGSGAQGRRSRTVIYMEDVESIEFDSATTAAAAGLANEDHFNVGASLSAPAIQSLQPVRPYLLHGQTTVHRLPARRHFLLLRLRCAPTMRTTVGQTRDWWFARVSVCELAPPAASRSEVAAFRLPPDSANTPDNDKLLRTEATGALIAVIGDDNDDFLLIGTRRDFVAQRDGVLFLGVNEGNLRDNTGTYDIVIEAEAGGNTAAVARGKLAFVYRHQTRYRHSIETRTGSSQPGLSDQVI